jgi:hypothetical protein
VQVAAFAVLYGCGQANSPVERQEKKGGVEQLQGEKPQQQQEANLPNYDVTLNQDWSQANIPARCLSVTTAATSEEDFRTLTAYFHDENPEAMAVVISFYPPRQTADISGSGEWFANEEAARTFLGPGYTDSDIQAIMDDEGMLVISMKDTLGELTTEMCAEWDVTTMGTPPPEWNCPGY